MRHLSLATVLTLGHLLVSGPPQAPCPPQAPPVKVDSTPEPPVRLVLWRDAYGRLFWAPPPVLVETLPQAVCLPGGR